ncbi:hypothetical protein MMC30_000885 [Trapelia coarctata]|nr:hypothetical protein [Trapelia coarctata]
MNTTAGPSSDKASSLVSDEYAFSVFLRDQDKVLAALVGEKGALPLTDEEVAMYIRRLQEQRAKAASSLGATKAQQEK